MSWSNAYENLILDAVFGRTALQGPTTLYFSLHTASPGETGANECSGNGYARAELTNNSTNFPAATSGEKSNNAAIIWPYPTGGTWGTVTHFGVWDASSSGTYICGGELSSPLTTQEDYDIQILGSYLTVSED